MALFRHLLCGAAAAAAVLSFGFAARADEIVIAANGGTMREAREVAYYEPFTEKTGTEVIPFDIEIYDQWARVEAMRRTGKVEFDIVNASSADLIVHRDSLLPIPCAEMPNISKSALPYGCDPYAVSSHAGALLLTYNKEVFADRAPQTWADFWDVQTFPGPRALPDSGDRAWWLPAAALLADGVKKEELFPLDLDRAYRKLDEIRPHITVWWKTASQMMQIMRDKEVVMTMGFSGRAYTAISDGAPFDISWEGALHDQGYLAVLKDAPNPEKALEFLDFMYEAIDGQVYFMNKIHYATFTQEALDRVPPADLKFYATLPANAEKIARPDWEWIARNQDMLNARFNAWITK